MLSVVVVRPTPTTPSMWSMWSVHGIHSSRSLFIHSCNRDYLRFSGPKSVSYHNHGGLSDTDWLILPHGSPRYSVRHSRKNLIVDGEVNVLALAPKLCVVSDQVRDIVQERVLGGPIQLSLCLLSRGEEVQGPERAWINYSGQKGDTSECLHSSSDKYIESRNVFQYGPHRIFHHKRRRQLT